jgi:DNA-binding response OmpR family regulator
MNRHILVVDDEAQIRDIVALFLNKSGYEVATVGTAAETLRAVQARKPDLVVLDIGLGEDDGLALLGTLKATYPEIKVIMLTGMGFVEELLVEAQERGADGYVSKLLPLDELLATIQRQFRSAAAQRPAPGP